MIYPHEVNGDSTDRIGCIAVGGMTTALDGNLALVFNCDLKNSCYLVRVTWLHAASGLDFLRFGVPYCKVWVVGARMKDGRKLNAQLFTLVVGNVST